MMRSALGGPRLLLRRLREVMAEPVSAQTRLDRIVVHIASNMVAEVCSVYVLRSDALLELYATEGLNREAVHLTTMKRGEGLVGLIAERAEPLALDDAQSHPAFSYRPETGEEIYHALSWRPDPARRQHPWCFGCPEPGAKTLFRRRNRGSPDDIDAARGDDRFRRAAIARAPGQRHCAASADRHSRRRARRRHRPRARGAARTAHRHQEDRGGEHRRRERATGGVDHRLARRDRHAGVAGRPHRRRRTQGDTGDRPHHRQRSRLAASAARGDFHGTDGGSGGRARAERHARETAAPERPVSAGASA